MRFRAILHSCNRSHLYKVLLGRTKNDGIDPLDQSSLHVWKSRLGEIFKSYVLSHDDIYQVRYIGLENGGRELVRVDRTVSGARITPEPVLQKKR